MCMWRYDGGVSASSPPAHPDSGVLAHYAGGMQHHPAPQRGRWYLPVAIVVAAVVVAGGAITAALISRNRTSTEPSSVQSLAASPACTAWTGSQGRLDAVPGPTGNWGPAGGPEGLRVTQVWANALNPILDDLDTAAKSDSGAAGQLLRTYVTAQRDGIAAAWTGTRGVEVVGQIRAAVAALDAACR